MNRSRHDLESDGVEPEFNQAYNDTIDSTNTDAGANSNSDVRTSMASDSDERRILKNNLSTDLFGKTPLSLYFTDPIVRSSIDKDFNVVEINNDDVEADDAGLFKNKKKKKKEHKSGTFGGVLVPTCENMWGVLIFLRFNTIVGQAGLFGAAMISLISFACAYITALSLSAIVTNPSARSRGGTYNMISRSLGNAIGGSVGIMYYFGLAFLCALEILGTCEVLLETFPVLANMGHQVAIRVFAAIFILVLATMVFFGIQIVSKLGVVFLIIELISLGVLYISLFQAPSKIPWPHRGEEHELHHGITGMSFTNFKHNFWSHFDSGASFISMLALFFPAVTGILSGADRADSLATPEKSIPSGTLGAITVTGVMYASIMILWAFIGNSDALKHAEFIAGQIAWPHKLVMELGIMLAALAQCLQCLIVAPRMLQAIAVDKVIPWLKPFGYLTWGEPRIALLFTTVIAISTSMIGALELVAPLLSICFLMCYASINFACFTMGVLAPPSWRPTWKYFHWSLALLGGLICIVLMFMIGWHWALFASCLMLLLCLYITKKGSQSEFGSGVHSLQFSFALKSLLSQDLLTHYSHNWRPQLLCLFKHNPMDSTIKHNEILLVASQLTKGKGLCIVSVIMEGVYNDKASEVIAEKRFLLDLMNRTKVQGFPQVIVAPSFREGKSYVIQASGLGGLQPNTVLLGWPRNWKTDSKKADEFMETLCECENADKCVLVVKNTTQFPNDKMRLTGTIDVWWIIADGNCLLIISYLLQQHKVWKKSKLRIFTIVEKGGDTAKIEEELKKILSQQSIVAEVKVIEMDEEAIRPYTHNVQDKLEERQQFLQDSGLNAQGGLPHAISELSRKKDSGNSNTDDNESSTEMVEVDMGAYNSNSNNSNNQPPSISSIFNLPKEGASSSSSPAASESQAPRYQFTEAVSNLNAVIQLHSNDAELVLMNLPDPTQIHLSKDEYCEYCDILTQNLSRVIFVHGSGKEVISIAE